MFTWETLENVNSVPNLFFDTNVGKKVGQIFWPFAAALSILVQAVCSRYGLHMVKK